MVGLGLRTFGENLSVNEFFITIIVIFGGWKQGSGDGAPFWLR